MVNALTYGIGKKSNKPEKTVFDLNLKLFKLEEST